MAEFRELSEIVERRSNGCSFTNARETAQEVTEERVRRRETETLAWLGAAGAVTSDVSDFAAGQAWESVQPPSETFEAIRLQYPRSYGPLSDGDITERMLSMSSDSRAGLLQGAKGKLFEMRVVDKLNASETVGGVSLESGQTAELAASATHPGSDILIHNADGSLASELSAKCSEYASVAKKAFERYPDIPVVGNEELASLNESVLDSGLSNESLAGGLFEQADSLESMSELLETLEPLGDFAPGLPLLFVVMKHGKPVVLRQTSVHEAMKSAWPDAAAAGAFAVVAAVLAHFDMGLVSVPLLFGGRWGFRKWKDNQAAEAFLADALNHINQVMKTYPRFGGALVYST